MDKYLKKILVLSIFNLIFSAISAQIPTKSQEGIYGPDPVLYNGKVYSYYLPATTQGTQYLDNAEYTHGTVIINGITFSNLLLNYDVFNQQLLLKYTGSEGAEKIIEVSKAWLNGFTIGTKNFILISGADSTSNFYQVLGKGNLKILFYWRKKMKLDGGVGSSYYTFSAPYRDSFVLRNDQLIGFKKNKNFISIFDPSKQQEIKNYMHQHRIRVKKSDDAAMEALIDFCNKL